MSWLSPLANQNYFEYRDDFLGPQALNLPQHLAALKNFWPYNGPQWDGLAILTSAANEAILLIEAKAHPTESRSDCKASNSVSIERIQTRLSEVREYMGCSAGDWMNGSYQLANRLAYLYFLHVHCNVPTYLVLVNFVNDHSHRPTSLETWLKYPWRNALSVPDNARLADRVLTVYPEAF